MEPIEPIERGALLLIVVGHTCTYVATVLLAGGVRCTCACRVCWSCREELAMERMMREVGLGSRVGLGGEESSRWWWSSYQAGYLLA